MIDDPFKGDAAAPVADPFGAPQGEDPFAAPSTTNFGPAPRISDLDGRLLALRLHRIEDRPKYKGKEGETEKTGIVDIGVLDGGMIYTAPEKDAPFGAPKRECGVAPQVFKQRFVSAKGILNKFPPGRNVILGRLGRLVVDKDVAKHLDLNMAMPTEADLTKVAAWLATSPPKDQIDKAVPFWTVVDVSSEARALAVKWVGEHPEFLA